MSSINPVVLKKGQGDSKGFTLIELVIVIAILGILATITTSYFVRYIEKAKMEVCNINCLQSVKWYNAYLEIEDMKHSEEVFIKFLKENDELCPKDGKISYMEEKFKCEIHSNDEGVEDDVPYI